MYRLVVFLAFCWLSFISHANFDGFEDWKQTFAADAKAAGVSAATLADFLATATPYERAVSRDRSQAEFKKFIWDYLSTAVSAKRIGDGQLAYSENANLLNDIATQTGVPAGIITAIWGMESSYGNITGSTPLVSALATLAYEGRRKTFFKRELLALLQLVDSGDVPSLFVAGSWAGGMGMTQFIPTTYQRYAIDGDGDGHRNLWQKADALASAAAYLQAMGWQRGLRWGIEVKLPDNFDYLYSNNRQFRQSHAGWAALGVTHIDGKPLPDDSETSRLFVPAGQYGPKFLLYQNFDVIKRYNNADAYALAVALLSERINNQVGLVASWPSNAKPLTVNDIKIVQTALNAKGFDAGKIDGIMGRGTRRALQNYQAANGRVADGFLTIDLYRQLITGID